MKKSFYQAFEDQHRGSRELIKNRLRVYLPFVAQLQALYPKAQALDLGCGRGEWLELLGEVGVTAHGVDLDEGMLSYCVEQGLPVTQGDILAFVKALPDNSQILVSGFHIAEHLAFNDLQVLIQEALRVLKPAGLLILETPNPENLVVGTANFYIDPTHQRPIPQPLLYFLSEYYGFFRSKVLRLQESQELLHNSTPSLFNVLSGASPDYAVIGQKKATAKHLAAFDEVFSKEFGISVETLAARYEMSVQQNYQQALELAKQSVQNAENRAQSLEAQLTAQQVENQRLAIETVQQQAENQRLAADIAQQQTEQQAEQQRLVTELTQKQAENQRLAADIAQQQTEQQAEQQRLVTELTQKQAENQYLSSEVNRQKQHQQELEARLAEASHLLHRYASSYSWRLMLPLRLATRPIRALLRILPKPSVLGIKKILRRYPRFYGPLLCFKNKLIPPRNAPLPTVTTSPTAEPFSAAIPPVLTPAARRIYNTLKNAITTQETP